MALKELRVSGGFTASLVTYLSDELGDLAGAVVKGALVPEGDSWPSSGSPLWRTCLVAVEADVATVSLQLEDDDAALGHCHWWLWVQDGAANVVVLVMDPDELEKPWHIWVH